MQSKTLNYLASCVIFVLVILGLNVNFEMLLADPDTAWHLAAGDLIRASGSIPRTDPWAFTSQGAPWINLAWLWDVWMSWLHAHFGWQGKIAFLCMLYAGTMALLYQACLLRSKNGIASFFTVFFVTISIPLFLRSMWVTNLFIALLYLLALLVRYRGWSPRWWFVMPALMPLWVNVHGGFVVAFVLLGAFGLQALLEKQWRFAVLLSVVGLLSIAGLAINPYGFGGMLAVLNLTFTTPALSFIAEFQPSTFSWSFLLSNLYIPVFLFCAIRYRAQISLAEAILGFGLLVLAATSMRYWTFVYLFSAPILAGYLATAIEGSKTHARPNPAAQRIAEALKGFFLYRHPRLTNSIATLCVLGFCASLFSPYAMKSLKLDGYDPYAGFKPAIAFLQKHYPGARILTDYSSSGPIIMASGGSFPVFIDGRGETAYPRELIVAYGKMLKAEPGWEEIFDTYRIDGILLCSFYKEFELPPRMQQRKGWTQVYKDDMTLIFMRDKK